MTKNYSDGNEIIEDGVWHWLLGEAMGMGMVQTKAVPSAANQHQLVMSWNEKLPSLCDPTEQLADKLLQKFNYLQMSCEHEAAAKNFATSIIRLIKWALPNTS